MRQVDLRQIEAFKAIIEHGTMSKAAVIVNISQPGMSKLIAHLEMDTGLKLFDRVKGRLAPTANAMRLYAEIDRIFAGVRQVENAIEAIRREEQDRISVGVMPALSGDFIERATMAFLKDRGDVFCSIQSLGSQWIVEGIVTRKLDVGLIETGWDNPYLNIETLMEHSLVCVMPLGHPLAEKRLIEPQHLDECTFVALNPDSHAGHQVEEMFESHGVRPKTKLIANIAPTLCQFVAAGLGVSLVHPLVASGLQHRLAVRRFEPRIMCNFQLCRSVDSRNARLVSAFTEQLRNTAAEISEAMLKDY